jgi:sarcosine oxidase subunit gamma
MTQLLLELQSNRDRLGLKGPRAAEWLAAHGIVLPMTPNTWTLSQEPQISDALLVARLGAAEFFLDAATRDASLGRISAALKRGAQGVYPVTREDWCLDLSGDAVHEVLAQVCNVNFAALRPESRPAIMTLMIGIAVLVVPRAERQLRIWCDPTFGPYLSESLGAVVTECGGGYRGDLA